MTQRGSHSRDPGFNLRAAEQKVSALMVYRVRHRVGRSIFEALAQAQSSNLTGKNLGRCLSLNTAGLTDIKIAEYRQWFKEFDVVAVQETHGERGQEAFLTQRLGFNQGAFSFKSRARAGVGLLWKENFTMIGNRTWTDNEGRVVCVGLELEGAKAFFCSVYAPNLTGT